MSRLISISHSNVTYPEELPNFTECIHTTTPTPKCEKVEKKDKHQQYHKIKIETNLFTARHMLFCWCELKYSTKQFIFLIWRT